MKQSPLAARALWLVLFSLFSVTSFQSQASAITIDGQLNDWGVSPGAFGSTDWTPYHGIAYSVEDHDPAESFLDPGWGGQDYDAEALYFKKEGLLANFVLVTGMPLKGHPGDHITFGDFAFDFDSDGSYEFGLETRGNQGFKKNYLYGNAGFEGPEDPDHLISGAFDLISGTEIGKTNLAYNKLSYLAHQHYVMEFSIPISFFGSFWDDPNGNPEFTLHWTMSCGNDAIDLYVPGTTTNVPEPGTMALLGLGLAGWKISRRRKPAQN